MEFTPFPKMPRLSRDIVITEKLDGSNASVKITPLYLDVVDPSVVAVVVNGVGPEASFTVRAGSRTRWVTPGKSTDNYGFAQWVADHAVELVNALGEGHHFGEWWGRGINRNYAQTERHFSLFNTKRWGQPVGDAGAQLPFCFRVVPVLWTGPFEEHGVMKGIKFAMTALKEHGSVAAPGFMNPEGIVVYHQQGNVLFKKTFENDDKGKEFGA